MSDGLVEIRDYTIEAEWFPAYREWATKYAAPWLKANLDVVEFWMDEGIEAEVGGSKPVVSPNGQPNVCWIIRWPNKAARDEGMKVFSGPEWRAIRDKHPNVNSYLHTNSRFMKAAG